MASYIAMNSTASDLPPLPSYTLTPQEPLIRGFNDSTVQMSLLVIVYWTVSLFFHLLDTYDFFPQYRLHTPAEVLKRNPVSRYEVLRDVLIQQGIQTVFGLLLAQFDAVEMTGKDDYNIAVWAQKIRLAERYIPKLGAVLGINTTGLANRVSSSFPTLASALLGGSYPVTKFVPWEMSVAKFIYHIGVPAFQFTTAIFILDTWQYFLHRAMHMNRFLYTWLHSRHHRLYVPYAYGALYNHPIEGFLLDTLGSGIGYLVTGMTVRQSMWFFTISTIKTIDDHCGYAFPWDPLQHFSNNNAAYHDIHHQSWGIKANFSQPFFTFWDRLLGTTWKGGDVSARYERQKIAAQKKLDADMTNPNAHITHSAATDMDKAEQQAKESQEQVMRDSDHNGVKAIKEERREEQDVRQNVTRASRSRSGAFDPKAFSDRVAGSLHGRSAAILHTEGVQ